MAHILKVNNLRKTYSDGFEAVKGVSFDVSRGEVFGILVEAGGQPHRIREGDAHHGNRVRLAAGGDQPCQAESRSVIEAGKGQIVRGFRIECEEKRAGERVILVHGVGPWSAKARSESGAKR